MNISSTLDKKIFNIVKKQMKYELSKIELEYAKEILKKNNSYNENDYYLISDKYCYDLTGEIMGKNHSLLNKIIKSSVYVSLNEFIKSKNIEISSGEYAVITIILTSYRQLFELDIESIEELLFKPIYSIEDVINIFLLSDSEVECLLKEFKILDKLDCLSSIELPVIDYAKVISKFNYDSHAEKKYHLMKPYHV